MRVELIEGPGHPLQCRERVYEVPPTNLTRVLVDGVWIEVRLFEHYHVIHEPAPKPRGGGVELMHWEYSWRSKYHRVPSGRLELQVSAGDYTQAAWRDRRNKPLELRVGEAIEGLLEMAAATNVERAEAARREDVQLRETLVVAARDRKKERVRERDRVLLKSLQNWRTARELREYAAEANAIAANGQCTVNPRSETGRLVRWAGVLANRLDPFTLLKKGVALRVAQQRAPDSDPDIES
jgi:hypothetical protein